jgi:hypothetical protein
MRWPSTPRDIYQGGSSDQETTAGWVGAGRDGCLLLGGQTVSGLQYGDKEYAELSKALRGAKVS